MKCCLFCTCAVLSSVPQLESEPEVAQIDDAPENVPFAIPEKWKWVSLGAISNRIHYGYNASAKERGNAKLLRITDIQNGSVNWTSVPYCSLEDREIAKFRLAPGDIVIARTGGTIGKSFLIAEKLEELAVFASYLIRVITDKLNVNPSYLLGFLDSPYYWEQLSDNSRGTGQPNVNAKALSGIKVPLPPIEEQLRIVAKISQLFEQIDRAEKAHNELSGPLSDRFRQLCLEKAIQGKLVPQLESEPEVAQIGEAPENVPFAIPEKWKWVRLGVFVRVISGTSYRPQDTISAGDGIRILRGGNVGQQYQLLTADNDVFVSKDLYSEDKQIRKGDIVIVASTGSKEAIGRPAFAEADINSQIGAFLRIIRCTNQDFVPFIQIIFMSDLYRGRIRSLAKGTNINNIKKSYIEDLFIPCPPVEEQHRIAAKINELLGAVVQLENTISAT